MVLDMEEGKDISIILGKPFLAMGKTMIDVRKDEMKLRVQEEEVIFNVFTTTKYPTTSDCCLRIDLTEAIVSNQASNLHSLETSLL